MKSFFLFILSIPLIASHAFPREWHVAKTGNNGNPGTLEKPFLTLGQAARCAQPGDLIRVHAGVYREWVDPPRGGISDSKRIVYRAEKGEVVEIKGSERITGWKEVPGKKGIWRVDLPDSFFGHYNPYRDLIHGDWFSPYGRRHHTGEVFLNDRSLWEVPDMEGLERPLRLRKGADPEGVEYRWYTRHGAGVTTIWANFQQADPNRELVEISLRPTCFYPTRKGVDYLTIDGFRFSQAATQWAPPTAEQVGMVAAHWCKGWRIENNRISHSKCSGITLGKERNSGQNVWSKDRSIDGSLHYIEVIFRAIREGWSRERIGGHVVRNNTIFACGQAGICGSMGAAFSLVENNHIYGIWSKRLFGGAEMGGIKFHGAVDAVIRGNRIHGCGIGIWLDWMTQGCIVEGNLLYRNDQEDLFLEVNHGPYTVANNILGSSRNLREQSQGGAYIHNLFLGGIYNYSCFNRYTPYFLPHSLDVAGISIIPGGDIRFFNNLFAPVFPPESKNFIGTAGYAKRPYPMVYEGNSYFQGAQPAALEKVLTVYPARASVKIVEEGECVYLKSELKEIGTHRTRRVSTGILGMAKLPRQRFERGDGKPLVFDRDYWGNARSPNPVPGPLETLAKGPQSIKIWPRP